jgi:hypothetical protein
VCVMACSSVPVCGCECLNISNGVSVFVCVYEGVCMYVQVGGIGVRVHGYVCEFLNMCRSESVHEGVCFCRFEYVSGYICQVYGCEFFLVSIYVFT